MSGIKICNIGTCPVRNEIPSVCNFFTDPICIIGSDDNCLECEDHDCDGCPYNRIDDEIIEPVEGSWLE